MYASSVLLYISTLIHIDSCFQDSDGEKSDDNLVVDVSNEVRTRFGFKIKVLLSACFTDRPAPSQPQDPASPRASPAPSPRENGLDKSRLLKKDPPLSPSSLASSSSTPSSKSKEPISLVSPVGAPQGPARTLLKGRGDGSDAR